MPYVVNLALGKTPRRGPLPLRLQVPNGGIIDIPYGTARLVSNKVIEANFAFLYDLWSHQEVVIYGYQMQPIAQPASEVSSDEVTVQSTETVEPVEVQPAPAQPIAVLPESESTKTQKKRKKRE